MAATSAGAASAPLSDSEKELGDRLIEIGTKLLDPPLAIDELLSQLDELEANLSIVEQAPKQLLQDCLLPSMKALIAEKLTRHTDDDVKVSVALCINEITRITAPDAPFNDDQMKECFKLTVTALGKLSHESSRSYTKALSILETVARVRSCLVMLDLECDGLVAEMFQLFLNMIRSSHPDAVFKNMETIMTLLVKENEDICWGIISSLLDSVKKENQKVLPLGFKLGEKVIKSCGAKLKPYIMEGIQSRGINLNDYIPAVSCICNSSSDDLEQNEVIAREEQRVEVASELVPDVICPEEVSAALDGNRVDTQNKDEGFNGSIHATENKDGNALDSSVDATQNKDGVALDGSIDAAQNKDFIVFEASANKTPLKSLARCSESKPLESTDAKQNDESDKLKTVNPIKSEIEPGPVLTKRGRKPNSLMNPEEGYEHYWMSGGTSDPKSPRRRKNNGNAKVYRDSLSKTVSKDKMVTADDKDAAAEDVESEISQSMTISVPEKSQAQTIGASTSNSLPDGSLPQRRKKKKVSIVTPQDEKSQTGTVVSPGKTPTETIIVAEQSESVTVGTSSVPDGSLADGSHPKRRKKKKGSMVPPRDVGISQGVNIVLPESIQTETVIALEKPESGIPNSSLPDGSQPKRGKKKASKVTQQQEEVSQNVSIVLPEETHTGTIVMEKPDNEPGVLPKMGKKKASKVTQQQEEISQNVSIVLPEETHTGTIVVTEKPDSEHVSQPKRGKKRASKVTQQQEEVSQNVSTVLPEETHTGTIVVTEKPDSEHVSQPKRGKKRASKVTQQQEEVSQNVSTVLPEETHTGTIVVPEKPDNEHGGLPDGRQHKKRRKKRVSMVTQEDVEITKSITIVSPEKTQISVVLPEKTKSMTTVLQEKSQSGATGTSLTIDGNLPDGNLPKKKRKKKGSMVAQEDPVNNSRSAKKKRLSSTEVEDKAAEHPQEKRDGTQVDYKAAESSLEKRTVSELVSPEVPTLVIESMPTSDHNKLPAKKFKKAQRPKKKSMVIQDDADKNSLSVSKECSPSGQIHVEASTPPIASVKFEAEETQPLVYKSKKRSRSANGKAVTGSTIRKTTPAPQVAIFEEGQSDHEEKPAVQSPTKESPKGRVILKKATTKKSAEKKIAGSTSKSSNKSNLGVTPKKMIKRKRTPAKKESKTPLGVEELDERLLGKRIKVWWPKDKTFYDGVVHTYDHNKRRHTILYTDGEKEILNLGNQRWELIKDDDETPENGTEIDFPSHDEGTIDVQVKKEMLETPIGSSKTDTSLMKEMSGCYPKRDGPSTDNPVDDNGPSKPVSLDTTEPQNTGKQPKLKVSSSGGPEKLSEGAQASSKKRGKKRTKGITIE